MASDSKKKIKATGQDFAKNISSWLSKPHGWKGNPVDAFFMSGAKAEAENAGAMEKYGAAKAGTAAALGEAVAAENNARLADFENGELNEKAKAAIAGWREAKNRESSAKKKTRAKAYNQAARLVGLCVALAAFFGVGMLFMGKSFGRFAAAFPFVFVVAVLAYLLAGQSTMKEYGIGYAACRAKKEELTLAVGMSLVFTSIMMIVIPNVVKAVGMDHALGGAWMGGTIDATGAVAAAGAFLSERALYVAATIKMIQNVLIGMIAFCVAVYWCARVDCAPGQRVSWLEIWYRFPKFVLGFIAASVIFSLIYQFMGSDAGYTMIDQGVIRGFTKIFRGWFFCLAFVSIGLATDFRELGKYFKGGKPLILYVCGQSFNLILTLTMAYIMFFIVFPEITAKI